MTNKTKTQKAHALITQYINTWAERYGKKPQFNRHRDRWGFEAMIEDLGYDRARQIIEFYFKTAKSGHPVDWLLYHYDQLNATFEELLEDEERRAKIRRETAERVRQWEEKRREEMNG